MFFIPQMGIAMEVQQLRQVGAGRAWKPNPSLGKEVHKTLRK